MAGGLPGISGIQLMRLLESDGWERLKPGTHGMVYLKRFGDETRVTVIPNRRKPLPRGTLAGILGPKQTGLGRAGLIRLLRKGK